MLSKPSGSLFSHRDACIANWMLAKLAGCGSGRRPSPIFLNPRPQGCCLNLRNACINPRNACLAIGIIAKLAGCGLYSIEYKMQAPIQHGALVLHSIEYKIKAPIQHGALIFKH